MNTITESCDKIVCRPEGTFFIRRGQTCILCGSRLIKHKYYYDRVFKSVWRAPMCSNGHRGGHPTECKRMGRKTE